jgi:hypothetical protein
MSFPQEVAAANRRLGILVGGLMACLASGMALAAPAFIEKPSVRPKPRQVEQAPMGELKLNKPGVGAGSVMSQSAQLQSVEKCRVSSPRLTAIFPLP